MRAKGDPWGAERRSQFSLPFDGEGTMDDGRLMGGGRQAREVEVWLGNVSGGNLVWPGDGGAMAKAVLAETMPDLIIANGMDPKDMEWVACTAKRDGLSGIRLLFFRPAKEGEIVRPWQRGMLSIASIVSFRQAFAERADSYVGGLQGLRATANGATESRSLVA